MSSWKTFALGGLALGSSRAVEVNIAQLNAEKADGALGTHVFFKLDPTSTQVSGGAKYRVEASAKVGQLLECDDVKRLFRPAGKYEAEHEAAELHLWYQATCEDPAMAIISFVESSDETTTTVTILEAEHKIEPSVLSNDPMLEQQSHYPAINLFEAWDLQRGSPDVVVQVLDTGIDMSHEDLILNIWTNEGEICGDGIDNDDNGFVDDCHGWNHADNRGDDLLGNHWHGSHCGGTIAADTDNGVGVAGVAGGTPTSPGSKLMISVGFGDTNVGGFAEALVYGADNGAQISSNSWGYTSPGAVESSVLAAIDYYNSKNGIVVFAAGNDNSNADYYPGYYEGVVAVAATDDAGIRASFSNYGDWIDIAAPGVNVYSTLTNDQYGTASGTSMACPHVAGVFALGMSANANMSKSDLLHCAYSTSRDVDGSNPGFEGDLGAGYIDAKAFVECVMNGAPSPAPTYSQAPTTSAPSLKPTISLAPTAECICDQTLKLEVLTDNYPQETTWEVTMPSPTPGCVVTEASGGDFTSANTPHDVTMSTEICAGQEYTFTIYDAYGDGVCCGYGQGSYKVLLGGAEIVSGGEFGTSESTTFTAPLSSSPSPTKAPIVQPSSAPTLRSPTTTPTPQPTTVPTKTPTEAPTKAPTTIEVPVEPVEFTMRSHPKLGAMLVARWKSGDASSSTHAPSIFVLEYKLKGSDEWVRDVYDTFQAEFDGHYYHILSDPNIQCGSKLTARVAAGNTAGLLSEFAESKERKLKC